MKKGVHPQYYPNAKVICACGNTFTTGSTKPEIQVEICNLCHPFFTGKMKYIDTLGRVERFQKQQQAARGFTKKEDRRRTKKKDDEIQPRTLKEMIEFQSKKTRVKK